MRVVGRPPTTTAASTHSLLMSIIRAFWAFWTIEVYVQRIFITGVTSATDASVEARRRAACGAIYCLPLVVGVRVIDPGMHALFTLLTRIHVAVLNLPFYAHRPV